MNKTKCNFLSSLHVLLFIALIIPASFAEDHDTMHVKGRHLYDPLGDKVILRGANAMIIYWDQVGELTYPELAKTGANCCRIFWTAKADVPPKRLDQTIQNCWEQNMIPMICVWDATGKWEKLDDCINYWLRPEVTQVLKKHEKYLLLNIANEAGKKIDHKIYREKYGKAIKVLREAGLRMPLVIDAANWGRDERYILDNADYLLKQDSLNNLIFSWHPWDINQPNSRYKNAIDESIEKDICMIIGEFSCVGVNYKNKINYEYIINYCDKKDISWLAWVWFCCGDEHDGHSITKDSIFGHWANDPWGKDIAIEHPAGIRSTSKRTSFMKKEK